MVVVVLGGGQISSVTVKQDQDKEAPELYLGFQQLSLAALQSRGVVYMIVGFAMMFLSLALTLFHVFFQRRKLAAAAGSEGSPALGGVNHRD